MMDKDGLEARDAKRDIAAELLEAADEIALNKPAAVVVPDAFGNFRSLPRVDAEPQG